MNNAKLDDCGEVVNYEQALARVEEQLKEWYLPDYEARPPFADWEREFLCE